MPQYNTLGNTSLARQHPALDLQMPEGNLPIAAESTRLRANGHRKAESARSRPAMRRPTPGPFQELTPAPYNGATFVRRTVPSIVWHD
jgi:hypothetical protein